MISTQIKVIDSAGYIHTSMEEEEQQEFIDEVQYALEKGDMEYITLKKENSLTVIRAENVVAVEIIQN